MSIAVDRGRIGGWARKNGYLQQLDAFLGADWDDRRGGPRRP
jgi:hypothetical protein